MKQFTEKHSKLSSYIPHKIYVIELACWVRIGKILVEFLSFKVYGPSRTIHVKDLLLWLFTNLRTTKGISIS